MSALSVVLHEFSLGTYVIVNLFDDQDGQMQRTTEHP